MSPQTVILRLLNWNGVSTKEQISEEVEILLDTVLVETHQLILHNDDHNTFEWVIECLVDICDHSSIQAEQSSHIVHFRGKCSVKEGLMEDLKPLKDGLVDRGLSATIN